MRSRPVIDRVVLIAVVACLGIGLVRFAAVAVTVPYAVYVDRRDAAAADAAGVPPTSTSVMERVAHSAPFVSWWGGRGIPYHAGGSYIAVISHHVTTRTLGCLIGLIAEDDQKRGILVRRVIVPSDRAALYGEAPGKLEQSANGDLIRTGWPSLASDSAFFSDVRVVQKRYNPVISAEQDAQLVGNAHLSLRSKNFYVGRPRAGGSGTWILLAWRGVPQREFLLVPIEASPVAGVK